MKHRGLPLLALAGVLAGRAVMAAPAATVPHLDHVVVVVMENHGYDAVRTQPFTASLIARGGVCLSAYAVAHPSQPNYIALWAGSTRGVSNDDCPVGGAPYACENLGQACEAGALTWRAYSEDLAFAGSMACSYSGDGSTGLYTRKHDPWTDFSNLNHANERPWTDLAADIAAARLPNLAFIIPNNCHNTHNGGTDCGVADGDAWLAANLPAVMAAMGANGTLVLTWDEDDYSAGNHILTVFSGEPVIPGSSVARVVTHVTLVRTITDLLGLPPLGTTAGETAIAGIWQTPVPALPLSWGHLKTHFR